MAPWIFVATYFKSKRRKTSIVLFTFDNRWNIPFLTKNLVTPSNRRGGRKENLFHRWSYVVICFFHKLDKRENRVFPEVLLLLSLKAIPTPGKACTACSQQLTRRVHPGTQHKSTIPEAWLYGYHHIHLLHDRGPNQTMVKKQPDCLSWPVLTHWLICNPVLLLKALQSLSQSKFSLWCAKLCT